MKAQRQQAMKLCEKDCFNCRYDDCILDGLGRGRPPEAADVKKSKKQLRMHEYYMKNREKQIKKSREYYQAHREEINARRRKKKD